MRTLIFCSDCHELIGCADRGILYPCEKCTDKDLKLECGILRRFASCTICFRCQREELFKI